MSCPTCLALPITVATSYNVMSHMLSFTHCILMYFYTYVRYVLVSSREYIHVWSVSGNNCVHMSIATQHLTIHYL